jgi:hypothetical protein
MKRLSLIPLAFILIAAYPSVLLFFGFLTSWSNGALLGWWDMTSGGTAALAALLSVAYVRALIAVLKSVRSRLTRSQAVGSSVSLGLALPLAFLLESWWRPNPVMLIPPSVLAWPIAFAFVVLLVGERARSTRVELPLASRRTDA